MSGKSLDHDGLCCALTTVRGIVRCETLPAALPSLAQMWVPTWGSLHLAWVFGRREGLPNKGRLETGMAADGGACIICLDSSPPRSLCDLLV